MKKAIKIFIITAIICVLPVFLIAQPLPNNDGSDPTGGGNTPVGGGAPIGSGLIIMLTLGAAYGAKKVYNINKKSLLD